MEKEEVELLPAGLVTCLLDGREVRILKISPKKLTVRVAEELNEIKSVRVAFYIFEENRYEEVFIKDYAIVDKNKRRFVAKKENKYNFN